MKQTLILGNIITMDKKRPFARTDSLVPFFSSS